MRTNGYRVIDCKGENLSEGHVAGIYAKIHKSKKPLVFSNFTLGENEEIQSPFFAGFGLFRVIEADVNGYDFIIGEDSGTVIKFTVTSTDDLVIGA